MTRYCENCEQKVKPQKDFNVLAFVVLLIAGFIVVPPFLTFLVVGNYIMWSFITPVVFGIGYLFYYSLKDETCPICGSKNWGSKEEEKVN